MLLRLYIRSRLYTVLHRKTPETLRTTVPNRNVTVGEPVKKCRKYNNYGSANKISQSSIWFQFLGWKSRYISESITEWSRLSIWVNYDWEFRTERSKWPKYMLRIFRFKAKKKEKKVIPIKMTLFKKDKWKENSLNKSFKPRIFLQNLHEKVIKRPLYCKICVFKTSAQHNFAEGNL